MKKTLLILISMIIINTPSFAEESSSEPAKVKDLKATEETKNMQNQEPEAKVPSATIKGAVEENRILSLNNCLKLALENNPEIQAAINNTEILKSKVGQARAGYVPDFSIVSGYTRTNNLINSNFAPIRTDNDFDSYTLGNFTVNQLIYDFGKTNANIAIQKLNHKSSKSNLQGVKNNVTFSVKQSYYYVLYALQNEEVMLDAVDQYEQLLSQAKAFYEIGTKPKIDVTIAKTNLNNAELNLIKAQNEVAIAFAGLDKSMGLIDTPKYSLKDKLKYKEYNLNFDNLLNVAYENRPEVQIAQNNAKSAKRQIKLSKTVAFPAIKARGQYSIGGADFTEDQGWAAGINLEVPSFDPYYTKKLVDEAKALLKRENSNVESTRQNVFIDVKQAFIKYLEAKQSVPVAKQTVAQAEENYNLAKGRYKVGLSNPIELKDAELMHRNAKTSYLQVLYNYNVAIANLENIVGKSL